MRADLLELTPEALTALANAGFVKRAQKDVAAGLLPKPGEQCRWRGAGALRRRRAHQPAAGSHAARRAVQLPRQRHVPAPGDAGAGLPGAGRVVEGDCARPRLRLRPMKKRPPSPSGAWSPAQFDDAALAASFAPSVLEQANKLAAARPVVGVQAWRSASAPPVARLPMCSVRFFSRSSLVHARCDCKQGSGCAHVVIAVWAFRQAGELPPGSAEAMVEVRAAGSAECRCGRWQPARGSR
jgi:hypothetical protein